MDVGGNGAPCWVVYISVICSEISKFHCVIYLSIYLPIYLSIYLSIIPACWWKLNALPTLWELCSDNSLTRAGSLQLTSCDPLISWPWHFAFSPSHRPLSREGFPRRLKMVVSQSIYLTNKQSSHLDPGLLLHFVLFLPAWAAPSCLTTAEFSKHKFYIHLHIQSPWKHMPGFPWRSLIWSTPCNEAHKCL